MPVIQPGNTKKLGIEFECGIKIDDIKEKAITTTISSVRWLERMGDLNLWQGG